MTATAERVTAAVRYLRRLPPLLNRAGRPVQLGPGPAGEPRAIAVPVGRLVVAPGQPVDPDRWGNVTYDQTVMTFANAAQRGQQWPAPLDGARSFLTDLHSLWTYRDGAWRGDPTGYVGTARGPASQTDVANGTAVALVSLTVPVIGGHRYLIDGYANTLNVGAGIAGYAALFMSLSGMAPGIGTFWLAQNYALAPGAPFAGNATALYHPNGSGSTTIALYAGAYSGLVVLRAAEQAAALTVTDLGVP